MNNMRPWVRDSAMTPRTEDFIAEITKHFREVDELTQVVLKGHLLLEERFNSILLNSVYNPEGLDRWKLSFNQKLHLAKAFCISPHREGTFELLTAINSLRNGIAHSLDEKKLKEK